MASQRPHPVTRRPVDAPLLTFDLPALLARVKREDTWANAPRTGLTLLKGQRLHVVLVALRAGATIPSRQTDSPISLRVVEGQLTFRTETHALTLPLGQLLTLRAGIPHGVDAVESGVPAHHGHGHRTSW
jgi:quercetin dioxygenase-like cupin family protein